MKNEKIMEWAGLICRIITGSIFIAAGTTKALASADILIWQFSGMGLPAFICPLLAYTLPDIEISAGMFLMAGLFMPFPALIFAVGLGLHEIILLLAWLCGLPASKTAYFGPVMSHSLPMEIFQNVLLILLIYPAVMSGRELTLDRAIEKNLPEKIK